ncbi:hypothetical protein HYV80_01270 [Candidatus Woesearchaeota archaeon]|nr:hypothetical protein [Candidatus Woesearchaeota archaeon]
MIKNSAKRDENTGIKEDRSFQILKLAVNELKERYNVSSGEILSLIEERHVSKDILIPVSIFETENLSALEAICKYLKEDLQLTYSKIALLLNRNSRTIWTTYSNAARKAKEKLPVKESKFFIPVSIFTDRKLSVLEAIVSHLKDGFNLRYGEIAALLNRDERNIWTAYKKAKKK